MIFDNPDVHPSEQPFPASDTAGSSKDFNGDAQILNYYHYYDYDYDYYYYDYYYYYLDVMTRYYDTCYKLLKEAEPSPVGEKQNNHQWEKNRTITRCWAASTRLYCYYY